MDESKIIVPFKIRRRFIQEHREWNFVYASDYLNKSFFGQAYEAAHELNSFPVPTIWKICPSSGEKFLDDGLFGFFKQMIDRRISQIPRDKPIIPFRRIGEGHSELNRKAPRLFKYLKEQINLIAYPNIEIDYYGRIFPLSS